MFYLFDFMEFLLLDLIFIFIKRISLYTFSLHKNSGISPVFFPKRSEEEIKISFHKCMIFPSFMYIDYFLSGVTTFFLLYCIFLTSAYNLVFLGGCKNYWDCPSQPFLVNGVYISLYSISLVSAVMVCVCVCGVLSRAVRLCLISLIHYSTVQ